MSFTELQVDIRVVCAMRKNTGLLKSNRTEWEMDKKHAKMESQVNIRQAALFCNFAVS